MKRLSYANLEPQFSLQDAILREKEKVSTKWTQLILQDVFVTEMYGKIGVTGVIVKASVACTGCDKPILVEHSSTFGPVDAFYNGLVQVLSEDHPSLKGVSFTSFVVNGRIDITRTANAQSPVHVTVGVSNSRKAELLFSTEGTSVLGSSLDAVLYALEFYVNAEEVYRELMRVYILLSDAGDTDRKYGVAQRMAEIVRVANYDFLVTKKK